MPGFDFKNQLDVGTALYYGLYTDTNRLSEIMHPLDKDLRDSIKYDSGLMKKLINSNLSIEDLTIATNTLLNHRFCEKINCAVFEAEPCDPNILGVISDLALQVDNIDVCVVFCRVSGGLKLSVRSCVREVMTNELAEKICRGIGSGRGHNSKAGGFISVDKLEECNAANPSEFFIERLTRYFDDYDQGIWPIKRAKFEASYHELDSSYEQDEQFKSENQYDPTVKDRIQGETVSLLPYIRSCVPTGESIIYAKKLERQAKVFTAWNLDGYMYGDIGDYLAVRSDDLNDAYVIKEQIFHKTYTKTKYQ